MMQLIEKMAFACVEEGINLGIKTTADGKINTSSWISHSINVSKVCACLANKLKLDINTAKILGLMHDYGRKYNHSFGHIIHGFEKISRELQTDIELTQILNELEAKITSK